MKRYAKWKYSFKYHLISQLEFQMTSFHSHDEISAHSLNDINFLQFAFMGNTVRYDHLIRKKHIEDKLKIN